MKLAHFRNKIIEPPLKVPMAAFSKDSVESIILKEADFVPKAACQRMEIDLANDALVFNGQKYPVSANGIPAGEFIIAEKWENPYWKRISEGMVYLPTMQNPLGRYLIILANPDTEFKIPNSIHQWPTHLGDFRPGKDSKGCIRMRSEDIKELFEKIMLGAEIKINY